MPLQCDIHTNLRTLLIRPVKLKELRPLQSCGSIRNLTYHMTRKFLAKFVSFKDLCTLSPTPDLYQPQISLSRRTLQYISILKTRPVSHTQDTSFFPPDFSTFLINNLSHPRLYQTPCSLILLKSFHGPIDRAPPKRSRRRVVSLGEDRKRPRS